MSWHLLWMFFGGGGSPSVPGGDQDGPPDLGPASFSLTGATNFTDANGTYCVQEGQHNGKPYYIHEGAEDDWYLYWGTDPIFEYSAWVVGAGGMYDTESQWYWAALVFGSSSPPVESEAFEPYLAGGLGFLTAQQTYC